MCLEPNVKPTGPTFKTFPKSTTLSEGETVKFECETETSPLKGTFYFFNYISIRFLGEFVIPNIFYFHFSVIWMKDSQIIKDDDVRFQFTQSGKKFQLTISNAMPDDTAQYAVCASDSSGEISAAFSLNVLTSAEL